MTSLNPSTLFIFVALLFVALFVLTQQGVAQPFLPSTPSQAPIDGGLSLLALGGAGLALKKLRNKSGN